MRTLAAISACALLALSAPAFAQGASSSSPGHAMQENGTANGSPGASGYAPERQMKNGTSGLTEGRSSATDREGTTGGNSTGQMGTGTGTGMGASPGTGGAGVGGAGGAGAGGAGAGGAGK